MEQQPRHLSPETESEPLTLAMYLQEAVQTAPQDLKKVKELAESMLEYDADHKVAGITSEYLDENGEWSVSEDTQAMNATELRTYLLLTANRKDLSTIDMFELSDGSELVDILDEKIDQLIPTKSATPKEAVARRVALVALACDILLCDRTPETGGRDSQRCA